MKIREITEANNFNSDDLNENFSLLSFRRTQILMIKDNLKIIKRNKIVRSGYLDASLVNQINKAIDSIKKFNQLIDRSLMQIDQIKNIDDANKNKLKSKFNNLKI